MFGRFKIILIGIVFLSLPIFVSADSLNQQRTFFVDSSYDMSGREEISATLKFKTSKLYFYIDNSWWKSLSFQEKQEIERSLYSLGDKFYYGIYPTLTSTFGSEWKPGIDNDYSITVLIHPMIKEARGYFSSADEYPRAQAPNSNEEEMVYLNASHITDPLVESFLAHEFVHLITFNQKEKMYGVEEETWLNEARAEYAPTLIGYDDIYKGSYLETRVKTFLNKPSDSSLFTQYLVEKYGIEILTDSLNSRNVGIQSLNEALEKNGFEEDFSQIFTDWTIAVLANDCSLGEKYCYDNENLKNVKVVPSINFLPLRGKSTLGVNQSSKNWAGNWFKFLGGKGALKVEFIGNPTSLFKVPYLLRDNLGRYSLRFFPLSGHQRGEILVSGFGEEVNSVTIIPSVQDRISGFTKPEPAFSFFWEVSTITEIEEVEEVEEGNTPKYLDKPVSEMTKEEILTKVSELTELIDLLKVRLVKLEGEDEEPASFICQEFNQNLYFGIENDSQVKCLQEFLKSQDSGIYPEGLVTGNFLNLTQAAVIRFQEKYTADILAPLGLEKGTGFFGPLTRKLVNKLTNW
jgi:hypothetical protein